MAAAVGMSERGDRELGQEPAGTSPPPTTNLTRQTQTRALQRSGSLWCSGRSWGAVSTLVPGSLQGADALGWAPSAGWCRNLSCSSAAGSASSSCGWVWEPALGVFLPFSCFSGG